MESVNTHNVNVNQLCSLDLSSIPYSESQLAKHKLWDGHSNSISIFGTTKTILKNLKNIKISLHHIVNFIKLQNNKKEDITSLIGFEQVAWTFISFIYNGGWDTLKMDNNSILFHNKVSTHFNKKITIYKPRKKSERILMPKSIEFSNLLSPQFLLDFPKKNSTS